MVDDYKKELRKHYFDRKETDPLLSEYLKNPTPKKLQIECLNRVSAKQYERHHEEMFKAVFDPQSRHNDHDKSITKFNIEKFKPILRFINGDTLLRDEYYVKLFAWLMKFDSYDNWKAKKAGSQYQNRAAFDIIVSSPPDDEKEPKDPYPPNLTESKSGNTTGHQPVGEKTSDPENETDHDTKPPVIIVINQEQAAAKNVAENPPNKQIETLTTSNDKTLQNSTFQPIITGTSLTTSAHPPLPGTRKITAAKFVTLTTILFALMSAVTILLWDKVVNGTIKQPSPDEQCMYWTGKHYQPTKCNEVPAGAIGVPLNTNTLNRFRKINLPDTMTVNSVGKVWCSKINGKYDFFTDGNSNSVNPSDTTRRIKPLSQYILNKYTSNHRFILYLTGYTCVLLVLSITGTVFIIYIRKQRSLISIIRTYFRYFSSKWKKSPALMPETAEKTLDLNH